MAKAKNTQSQSNAVRASKTQSPINTANDENALKQVFKVTENTTESEVLRVAALPGTVLEFDVVFFKKLPDEVVEKLSSEAQKAYWKAEGEFEARRKMADRALFETPTAVDPTAKLLDGPRGMANPLNRDRALVSEKLPGYYVTWRIIGGQGDFEQALQAGFKVICHPKDDTELKNKSPLDWSGDRWTIRDGTLDPTSGDQIYNVMVAIRQQIWDDNLKAMSLASHNAYASQKKQFIEGADNISRDSKEVIEVSDLDELHAEEHTIVQEGKRVHVGS
jgi:hypothetical protein